MLKLWRSAKLVALSQLVCDSRESIVAAMSWQRAWNGRGSGSQPSGYAVPVKTPEWWPEDHRKKPITHVYRIMRPDLHDLVFDASHRTLEMDADSDSAFSE